MTGAALAGLLAGYGVAIPVGAIAVLIMGLSARTSFRVGAAAALGVATADGFYAAAAVLGGAAIADVIAPAATALRWIAATTLILLAARTAVVAVRHHRDPVSSTRTDTGLSTPGRAYLGVLALTLLNPATVIYFVALVLGGRATATAAVATVGGQVVFVVAAFVASASWQLLIAGGGTLIGRALAGPRGRLGTALASSALIVVLAGLLVW